MGNLLTDPSVPFIQMATFRVGGFFRLLSHRATANLSGMNVERPIRALAGPGKMPPPECRKLPYLRVNSAVDAWDSRSGLDEDSAGVSNGRGADREERLLRFVDILRADQVRGSIVAEGDKTGFHRWRGPGRLLAVVIIVMGAAAAFLQASGPPHVHPDAQPDSAVGTALVQPASEPARLSQRDLPQKIVQPQPHEDVADVHVPTDRPVNPIPTRRVPEALSLNDPRPSEPVPAEQQVANPPEIAEAATPSSDVTMRSKSIDLLAPRHETDALARRPLTRATAEVSESETAKPVLWVYYPYGSSRAEANARILLARIDSNFTGPDVEAQTNVPTDAVIKFSEERNHALARMIGRSLGDLGYRWKIENTSSSVGSGRNVIEIWLPR
jgi:hypothetical protein